MKFPTEVRALRRHPKRPGDPHVENEGDFAIVRIPRDGDVAPAFSEGEDVISAFSGEIVVARSADTIKSFPTPPKSFASAVKVPNSNGAAALVFAVM